jgi:hypothetical protein
MSKNGGKIMRKRKGTQLIFSLAIVGLVTLSTALLSPPSWGAKPVDNDGDGSNSRNDCNDNDPAVYPGAPEICDDGKDNQCPGDPGYGQVDAEDPDCAVAACTDLDEDGYYAEAGCAPEVDCDDSDDTAYPGAPELCTDSVDNNCDGFTNESCTACTDADGDGYFGSSACGTEVDCNDAPGPGDNINPGATDNTCDGVDDNCDGQIDEGCTVTGDSDGDGFLNSVEEEGFALIDSGFMLWDESVNDWVSSSIPGSLGCGAGEKCLNPYQGDLFVIWRPLSPSLIDLASSNIFELANSPTSNFTVWVLKEVPPFESTTRQITTESAQKAVVLIEDPSMYGTTGFSQPGSIMIANKGKAWIYSHQIADNVTTNCGGSCKVDGVTMPDEEINWLHFKNTAAHEIWHVIFALNTADLHITDDKYIMNSATVFTQKGPNKTYTIGDEFSPSGMTDPKFQ